VLLLRKLPLVVSEVWKSRDKAIEGEGEGIHLEFVAFVK
jgi:hypothetical protein